MKRFINLIVTAAMILSVTAAAIPASAYEAATVEEHNAYYKEITVFPDPAERSFEYKEDNFTFNVYRDFAIITDYSDRNVTEISIPAEVINTDTNKKVPVVGISDIPFGLCWNLEKITIPDTLEHFSWYDLSSTTLVNIDSDADPAPKLKEIVVSDTNPYYTSVDGLLYTKDMKTLIGCPPALDMKELKISDKTETISDYAFFVSQSLEKAVIPATVKHIHNNAFAGCMKLKSAELPETITSISGDMFFYCTALTDVKFNGKIEKIGYGSFNHCDSLTDFTIPETVTIIGSGAFEDSPCIENVDGVHYLGNWAVGSDEGIEKAVVREGTVGIAEMTFMSRHKCTLVDIPASVKYQGYITYSGLSFGKASIVNYRAAKLEEKSLAAAKNVTDFYFYDPECDIFDGEKTIPAEYKYTNEAYNPELEWTLDYPSVSITDDKTETPVERYITGDVTIHGYEGSTAQKYAEKYNRKFELINDKPTYIAGDINGDGIIGVADGVCLQTWLLSGKSDYIADWRSADLCKDDIIDVYDMVIMRKKITGK